MEAREAIEVLTDKNTSIGTLKCDDMAWRKLKPAIDTAVEALKKQIPQKPIYDGLCACPNCHTIMLQGAFEARGKCCKECGQALDWGENSKD